MAENQEDLSGLALLMLDDEEVGFLRVAIKNDKFSFFDVNGDSVSLEDDIKLLNGSLGYLNEWNKPSQGEPWGAIVKVDRITHTTQAGTKEEILQLIAKDKTQSEGKSSEQPAQ